MIYTSMQDERLDHIVFNYYGDLEMMDRVLELNPSLIDVFELKENTTINLPDIPKSTQENKQALW